MEQLDPTPLKGGRKSSRKDFSQSGKSRHTSRGKKRSRGGEKAEKSPSQKQDEKKGESFFNLAVNDVAEPKPSFHSAWIQGAFSVISLAMINSVGLSVNSALAAVNRPIAGRIKFCIDSWHKITCSLWVHQVVREAVLIGWTVFTQKGRIRPFLSLTAHI